MKKILIFFCLFNFYLLTATEQDIFYRKSVLRVYLCSRLTEAAKLWNNEVSGELGTEFAIFRPQDIDLHDTPPSEIDWIAYQADFEAMKQSDLLLVLPPYGKDCAWEIGWFCGKERPAIAYVETGDDWLRDGMVKGGLTGIITNNVMLYNFLLGDPATARKSYLVSSKRDLGKVIKQIYHKEIQKTDP